MKVPDVYDIFLAIPNKKKKFSRKCMDQRASPENRLHPCPMRQACVSVGSSNLGTMRMDRVACMTRTVREAHTLFRAGETFKNLYVIRRGSFKSVVLHVDGREQITGFRFPGEILGLDGISSGILRSDAIALEDSIVCVASFVELERTCRIRHFMQRKLHVMMSAEIVKETSFMLSLGGMCAERRLAAFLLNIAQRYEDLGYATDELRLKMTRRDIAECLGLSVETVSRMFTKLEAARLLDVQGKLIHVIDPIGLAALV